jgi:hypothetical protein
MLTNAFIGKKEPPTDSDLTTALGPTKTAWDQFLAGLAREHDVTGREWKNYYSAKWGWSLRVLRKKRTIVWLSPSNDGFEVLFILGERAMQAARAAKLPQAVAQALATAPKYPEGTGVRLRVNSSRSLRALKQLAAIKVAN